jgi:hypothetical protein
MKTRILFLFTLLCAAMANVQSVHATTLTVQDTGDGVANIANCPGSGCRLRDALAAANAAGGDTIDFSATTPATITLTSGELLVNKSVTINGPGADMLTVDGHHASRVFHISSGKTVTISGLTITNGFGGLGGTFGGGIYNDHATLTINNCTVSGNSAGRGAGITNDGRLGSATLTVLSCTISGNSTNPFGGAGIYNDGFDSGSATLLVVNSTINNNTSAEVGGGIRSEGGSFGSATVSVINSTISGNSATGADSGNDAFGGGGIQNDGKNSGSAVLEIVNSTFSGNSANLGGGGIYNDGRNGSATVTLGDTIFQTGSVGENIHNNSGTVTSHGYNLSSDDASAFLNQTGDQNSIDPMLGALQNNGGPTFTHALLPGSPAIDQGKNFSGSTTDQRGNGFVRTFDNPFIPNAPGGDGTDIGAFEVQTIPPCPQPQGYWKNNPDAWPVNMLTLGNQSYTESQLLIILNTPVGTGKNADASLILADQLIAAKLNIANGADGTPVTSTITHADSVLSGFSGMLPFHVKPSTMTGQAMVNDAATLESFNKGMLTPGCSQ